MPANVVGLPFKSVFCTSLCEEMLNSAAAVRKAHDSCDVSMTSLATYHGNGSRVSPSSFTGWSRHIWPPLFRVRGANAPATLA